MYFFSLNIFFTLMKVSDFSRISLPEVFFVPAQRTVLKCYYQYGKIRLSILSYFENHCARSV